MMMKLLAGAVLAYALTAAAAPAASLDLAALGLVKGAPIATSMAGEIEFDATDPAFPFLSLTVSEAPDFEAVALSFSLSPLDLPLQVTFPVTFDGALLDYDLDTSSAVGLFEGRFGGSIPGFLLLELSLPGGSFPQDDAFSLTGVTVSLYEVGSTAVIPLPAAAPLLLAGIGALAVVARRRKG
jgi:hypothetical protein